MEQRPDCIPRPLRKHGLPIHRARLKATPALARPADSAPACALNIGCRRHSAIAQASHSKRRSIPATADLRPILRDPACRVSREGPALPAGAPAPIRRGLPRSRGLQNRFAAPIYLRRNESRKVIYHIASDSRSGTMAGGARKGEPLVGCGRRTGRPCAAGRGQACLCGYRGQAEISPPRPRRKRLRVGSNPTGTK